MHPDFWHARWREGRIGFHEGTVNAYLRRFWDVDPAARVLVPLCGKTHDLHWLAARGHHVTGVELSALACEAVFAEHGLRPIVSEDGAFVTHAAGGLEVLQGDFFALRGAWDALWDRAALIALPPELRPRYVAHLRSLLRPGARGLIVTLDYPQEEREGPPFSVPADEVRALWPEARLLLREEGGGGAPPGVSRMTAEVWAIELPG